MPVAEDEELAVDVSIILNESRMREIRTSGLTSGGEETRSGKRLRHQLKAKAVGNSLSLFLKPDAHPLDSTKNSMRLFSAVKWSFEGVGNRLTVLANRRHTNELFSK